MQQFTQYTKLASKSKYATSKILITRALNIFDLKITPANENFFLFLFILLQTEGIPSWTDACRSKDAINKRQTIVPMLLFVSKIISTEVLHENKCAKEIVRRRVFEACKVNVIFPYLFLEVEGILF